MDWKKFNSLGIEEQVKFINAQLIGTQSFRKVCDQYGFKRSTVGNRFKNSGYTYDKYAHEYIIDNNMLEQQHNNNNNNNIVEESHKTINHITEESHNDIGVITEQQQSSNNEEQFKKDLEKIAELKLEKDMLEQQQNNNIVKESHKTINHITEKSHNTATDITVQQQSSNIEGQFQKDLEELVSLKNDIKKMLLEYNANSHEKDFKININQHEFQDKLVSRTFIIRLNILNKFDRFCEKHKEYRKQDILSQALKEFIEKYA